MDKTSREAKLGPAGEIIPPEEEIINIEGPQGQSIFHHTMSYCVSQETIDGLQQKINEILKYVGELNDDRLLVLVGALIVENAIDELLVAIMPGYKSLRDKRDFTFSMRIEITRALRLIPSRILNCADFIRGLRNDFVHDLSINAFDRLESPRLQSMRDRLLAFNPQVFEEDAKAFSQLVLWTGVALYVYTMHVSQLNDFIRSSKLPAILQAFVGQN
jgi:hypothetical protein